MTDKTLQTFVLQYYPDLDRPLQCARLAEQATAPLKTEELLHFMVAGLMD